jgi:hypothetical protein
MHLTVSQRPEGSIPSLGTSTMMVMEEQKKGEEYIPYEEKTNNTHGHGYQGFASLFVFCSL